jgi:hypothetical protein
MAQRLKVLRCTCRQCTLGLHRGRSKKNAVYFATVKLRRKAAAALRKEDYEAAQDVIIESAGYTD